MGEHSTSNISFKAVFFILINIALLLLASNAEARLYKWVDSEGITRYGDKLPSEYTNKKHYQLDPEGRVILVIEAGKSPEQTKKERVLAKRKAEEKAAADKAAKKQRKIQNQKDRVLLLTFNSEDDIFYSRDQRLQVLDSKISLLNKNKQSSNKKLMALNDQAEIQYRSKKQDVPGGLQQKIEQMSKKILIAENSIVQSERKRAKVISDFNKDLTRFRDLKERQRKNKNEHK